MPPSHVADLTTCLHTTRGKNAGGGKKNQATEEEEEGNWAEPHRSKPTERDPALHFLEIGKEGKGGGATRPAGRRWGSSIAGRGWGGEAREEEPNSRSRRGYLATGEAWSVSPPPRTVCLAQAAAPGPHRSGPGISSQGCHYPAATAARWAPPTRFPSSSTRARGGTRTRPFAVPRALRSSSTATASFPIPSAWPYTVPEFPPPPRIQNRICLFLPPHFLLFSPLIEKGLG